VVTSRMRRCWLSIWENQRITGAGLGDPVNLACGVNPGAVNAGEGFLYYALPRSLRSQSGLTSKLSCTKGNVGAGTPVLGVHNAFQSVLRHHAAKKGTPS